MSDGKEDKKSNLAGWVALLGAIATLLTAIGFPAFFPDLVKRFFAEAPPQSVSSPTPQITPLVTPVSPPDSANSSPTPTDSDSNKDSSSSETALIKKSYERASGDPAGAIKILNEIIQKNPNSAEAYLARALTYAGLYGLGEFSVRYFKPAQCQKALDDYDSDNSSYQA